MSKVAVMMSENRQEAQLSAHFGKAEWIMIADTETRTFGFLKNEGGNGKEVVEFLIKQNCSDVIFTEIGEGARQQLQAQKIQGWQAPAELTGQQALQMFEHTQLCMSKAAAGHGHSCGCHSEPKQEQKHCCGGCK